MTGSLPPNLILSLIFGAGQIVVGAWLAWHTLSSERRGQWRAAVPICAGLWFVVSGVIELFVSGMESSLRLTGAPAPDVFTLWRGRADATLYVATALLALGALLYPALYSLAARRWNAGSTNVLGDALREASGEASGEAREAAREAAEGERGR
ncbi:MAG TPA: hypothetical protein VE338_08815 [Ktedonobacterales bacterium]|jgi:uncharacterized membrane protein|nr:hypothetical protein [Ktedonobacterales bacterium]